jgi:hypothetical protein
VVDEKPSWPEPHFALASLLRDAGARADADRHDQTYLALAPNGALAEVARTRIERATP